MTTDRIESDAMDAYSSAVSAAAERAGPAVVQVELRGVERKGRGGQQPAGDDAYRAAGSGVIFDSRGRVVTNAHVVQGAGKPDAISVVLPDGRRFKAAVEFADATVDVAVLRIAATGALPVAELVTAPVKVGQLVDRHRQPVRTELDRDGGRRQRAGPVAAAGTRPAGDPPPDPDRHADQPRQLRRAAGGRPGPRHSASRRRSCLTPAASASRCQPRPCSMPSHDSRNARPEAAPSDSGSAARPPR